MGARANGAAIVLVPTMGFLHDGHRALLKRGRAREGLLVLSIFVNPSQFGPKEDLSAYPRDLEADLRMAEEEGVDIAFVPDASEIYPEGYSTWVEVEGLSDRLCGASRPGHFRGVATVVLKLFNSVLPDKAVFGRKDFQQLCIIKRMAADLDLRVEIIGVDTVREPDGLAMSSRNSYLTPEERRAASAIPAAIEEARRAVAGGERKVSEIIKKCKNIIEKERLAVVDYIKVCHQESLDEVDEVRGGSVLFLAVRIGRARLIDNAILS
ncbi:MAG TPA: pantoate--beta-alanine ligase [Thermodesulfobacteriota bacterium]